MKSILYFFLFYSFTSLSAQGTDLFSPSAIKADLALVKKVVYDFHPRAFQWYPRDSFDLWFAEAESKVVKEMTQLEFQQLIFKIYKKIGCGHSRVMSTKSVIKARDKAYRKGAVQSRLPLQVMVFGDSLFVRKYLNKDSLMHRRDRILAINGISSKELLNMTAGFITSDGYNETHIEQGLSKNFETYYHRFFPFQETYEVTFLDSLGVKKTINVPGNKRSKAKTKARKKELKKNPVKAKKKQSDLQTINKKGGYVFSRSKRDSSLVVLKISKFAGKQGKKFYKKAFKKIAEDQSIKALAVDLRGNGGGDADESFTLCQILNADSTHYKIARKRNYEKAAQKELKISRFGLFTGRLFMTTKGKKSKDEDNYFINFDLPPHKKYHYTGPLYVLINGYSFSASSVVSSFLKSTGRATFIGEETGGGYHGTNAMQTHLVTLPNTTVRLRLPFWSLDQLVDAPLEGRGIFPDYPTQWSSEDYFNGNDPDMEVLYRLRGK